MASAQKPPGARFYVRDEKSIDAIGPRPGSERQTDAQGFAQWDHLLPGPVFLDVNHDPACARFWSTDKRERFHDNAPNSARPGGSQATDGSLYIDVLPGRGDDPIIVRTERGVRVSGRVLDPQGRPVGGRQVNVLARNPDRRPGENDFLGLPGFSNVISSDADGTFRGWCIPAGNGGLTCLVADAHRDALGNGHGEPFPSAPGDEREVTIQLTTGGWIEGSVVDAQGNPRADTPVVAAVMDGFDGYVNHLGLKTDAQGRFRIGPLRPAEYEVRARGEDSDWDPSMAATNSALALGGMHQPFFSQGLSAFFERPTHGLSRDRVHHPRFDQVAREQVHRPGLTSLGRSRAHQGDQRRLANSDRAPTPRMTGGFLAGISRRPTTKATLVMYSNLIGRGHLARTKNGVALRNGVTESRPRPGRTKPAREAENEHQTAAAAMNRADGESHDRDVASQQPAHAASMNEEHTPPRKKIPRGLSAG